MNANKGTRGQARPSPTDWSEIHRRLEAAQAVLERGGTPAPEEKKSILKARAEALAREPERQGHAREHLEIVAYLLGREKYGIETRYVREVCPLKELTPLPGTPRFVLGIVNLRGQVLSVIDIKKLFDLPEKGLNDLDRIIVLRDDRMEFGVLANSILGVIQIPLEELQPSLPTLTGIREEYLKGVTRDRTVILDGARLLSDENIVVHEEA